MAAQMPFRVVAEVVSALTAGVLSKSSVHRLLQDVGQDALDEDRGAVGGAVSSVVRT